MSSFQLINPSDVPPPRPTYSHVQCTPLSSTSTLVTIAGQIGVDISTGTAPEDFIAQVEIALSNLGKCLAAAGATPKDIVKMTQFVVNLETSDNAARSEAYCKFLGGHRPPSTLVGVAALAAPNWLYEVEAMAIVHHK
ncbi:uncharacterized protein Z519_05907 [Cladophialophora bantiana CBS 173.52]|uniref:Uncharacterized protein n=1 Tax=Cladophialophora bantiana (strain ATCC 10958 / CBS 173.52 / CDC B-1940 / NIH 8579) TaxID=1442370 RepID=A0A0D2G3Q1_CLAB1|nr:uncharacterized protein Z519_05907 [Cladophialophora bantiana CBS 173.52]KIW93302.1 hypothetical protein Z519_05907 [Cladophialophora bantiana CBS 173.52]